MNQTVHVERGLQEKKSCTLFLSSKTRLGCHPSTHVSSLQKQAVLKGVITVPSLDGFPPNHSVHIWFPCLMNRALLSLNFAYGISLWDGRGTTCTPTNGRRETGWVENAGTESKALRHHRTKHGVLQRIAGSSSSCGGASTRGQVDKRERAVA